MCPRIKEGRAAQNLRSGQIELIAGDKNRCRAISEESGGNQVGNRQVVSLPCEGTKLDAKQHGNLLWISTDIIRGAHQACSPGDATQPEDWIPLDLAR